MKQHGKVKLFRTLKVVFYCMGLPLFVFATLMLATGFFNEAPFSGTLIGESEIFAAAQITLTSSALYGLWVAFGVWFVIAMFQLIFHKTIKNRRSRMLAVVCVILVTMLAPVFAMDFIFDNRLDEMAAKAMDGVVVESYNTQLSYYRMHTSDAGTIDGLKESYTDTFIKKVDDILRVYNIGYGGTYLDGTAYNMGNTPITYADLGLDYKNDGDADNDDTIIKLAPTGVEMKKGAPVEGTGYLEIDGVKYENYFWVMRAVNGKNTYIWYSNLRAAEIKDGAYGEASYNYNGLLSDGYIFGIDTALRILEDYYSSQEIINEMIKEKSLFSSFEETRAVFMEEAYQRQEDYYLNSGDEELEKLWYQEIDVSEDFTLTRGELENLIGMLGTILGSNSLFDLLFNAFGDKLEVFENGASIKTLVGSALNSVFGFLGVNDLWLTLSYMTPERDYLYIKIQKDDANGDVLIELPLNEDFSLDTFSDLINKLLGSLGLSADTVSTVLKVLGIFGLNIDSSYLINENNELEIDITQILLSLIEGLYWYQSPVIKPYYMFYVDETLEDDDPYKIVQEQLMKYDMAYYEGAVFGKIVGSTLIGDEIGDGSYTSDKGLSDLAAVRQLQSDLSYKPVYYPLFSVRDMLATFVSIVIMFTFFSYICAEKEFEWATGTVPAKKVKIKKKKKGGKKSDDVFDEALKPKPDAENESLSGNGDVIKEDLLDTAAAESNLSVMPDASDNVSSVQSEDIPNVIAADLKSDGAAEESALNVPAQSDKEVK